MFLEFSVVGLVPAAVVVLAATYVRARRAEEKLARRWLLFLFSIAILLHGAQFLILRLEMYGAGAFLQPAVAGTLVALVVHLGATRELWSRKTIWITLSTTLAVVALMIYWWKEAGDPLLLLISVITALAWQAWEWPRKRRWPTLPLLLLLLLVVCAGYLIPTSWLMDKPKWLYGSIIIGNIFVWPIVAVVLAARLVCASVAGHRSSNWPITVIRLALVTLLLLLIGDIIVTETVWVQAEDSISLIPVVVFIVATAAAMLLAWELTGWRRLAALVFALSVMFTASYASEQGWRTSPAGLTEVHAEKVNRAIQRYYERQDHYPSRLTALTPFYLWRIPQPMIFRDQTWCYEGGDDYYRLGYVHQPGFGFPPESISIHIHAAAGELPDPSWPCDEGLEKARSKAASYWDPITNY